MNWRVDRWSNAYDAFTPTVCAHCGHQFTDPSQRFYDLYYAHTDCLVNPSNAFCSEGCVNGWLEDNPYVYEEVRRANSRAESNRSGSIGSISEVNTQEEMTED
jgi:hypothetical protein